MSAHLQPRNTTMHQPPTSRARFRIVPLLATVAAIGCRATPNPPAPPPAADLAHRLTLLIDSTVSHTPSIPGLLLRVEVPGKGFAWTGAAGLADRATGEKLTTEHVFRIASNTKTYVAAAILRLVEQGKLSLDDPILRHLDARSVAALEHGGYDPAVITIRQLLQHVSGLYDYATSEAFATAVLGRPEHRWTRAEQLAFAMTKGKPYGKPGQVYHYSDTGYILLGEILERRSGLTLGSAVRDLVGFGRLHLEHTWFETLDSVPPGTGPRAHQYQDSIDIYRVDPSFDLYGGGGLVATITELTGFYRALGTGGVFERRATLDTMEVISAPSVVADSTRGHGMGIVRRRIAGVTCWGHGGHWGSVGLYCPAIDVAIGITSNQSRGPGYDELSTVALVIGLVQSVPPAPISTVR